MRTPLRALFLGLACAVLPLAGRAAVDDILAKARAYLGPDAALEAVESVRYVGSIDTGADGKSAPIEIIFARPVRHRIEVTGDKRIEVTVLDDYEGWQRVQSIEDPSRWQVTLLGRQQIKRMRAITLENLAFFRATQLNHGHIEDLGTAEVDGTSCRKLRFVHDDGIHFTRYFDPSDGRLVLTETADGTSIREEGEIRAGGIRFPQRLINTNQVKDAEGAETTRTVTITFDRILVNEPIDPADFALPALAPGQAN